MDVKQIPVKFLFLFVQKLYLIFNTNNVDLLLCHL